MTSGVEERNQFEDRNPRKDPYTSRRMRSLPYTSLVETDDGTITVDPGLLERPTDMAEATSQPAVSCALRRNQGEGCPIEDPGEKGVFVSIWFRFCS